MPRLRLAVALASLVALVPGCRPATVTVAFEPRVGSTQRYRVVVSSTSVVRLAGQPSETTEQRSTLQVTHRVLGQGPEGVEVDVVVDDGTTSRRLRVELDRAGQLTAVSQVEGLPASIFADSSPGLTEVFPAAAGAPPARPLEPGERWSIDEAVELPGQVDGRLRGQGRLTELAVDGDRRLAVIESRFSVPVRRTSPVGGPSLDGRQTTFSRTVRDLTDGTVRRATSRTEGTFAVTVPSPAGRSGAPVPGTVEVVVTSTTTAL